MHTDLAHELEVLASSSLQALLESYGRQLASLEPAAARREMDLIAVLPFFGDELRGSLAIAGTHELIARSNIIAPTGGIDMQRDWIGELSNQLLGRIKNQLIARGVVLQMHTPLVVTGKELRPVDGNLDLAFHLCFETDVGRGELWMQAQAEPSFVLPEGDAECDACADEGVMLFF